MEFPKLKRILTDPDGFISNSQLKALSMELLDLIPIEGIEGSPLDSDEIMEVVLPVTLVVTGIQNRLSTRWNQLSKLTPGDRLNLPKIILMNQTSGVDH